MIPLNALTPQCPTKDKEEPTTKSSNEASTASLKDVNFEEEEDAEAKRIADQEASGRVGKISYRKYIYDVLESVDIDNNITLLPPQL